MDMKTLQCCNLGLRDTRDKVIGLWNHLCPAESEWRDDLKGVFNINLAKAKSEALVGYFQKNLTPVVQHLP